MPCGAPRIHLPVPLAAGVAGVLGQPRGPAQRDQRLPRTAPADAPGYDRGRAPGLTAAAQAPHSYRARAWVLGSPRQRSLCSADPQKSTGADAASFTSTAAAASGDRVAAENLCQHAEHYFRIMNAANEGHQHRATRPDTPPMSKQKWPTGRFPRWMVRYLPHRVSCEPDFRLTPR